MGNILKNRLLLLIAFHSILFLLFQHLNKAYQTWDSAGHIGLSFIMANKITAFIDGSSTATIADFIKTSNYYPPFVQMIGAVFSLIFGYSSRNILIIALAFFILAIVYTYKTALYLSKNENTAFYTTLVFSFFPEILEQSHLFHLDVPLVALLMASTYYLLTSELFTKRSATLLFFIFGGLAQVTKWYAIIYLLIPFGFVFLSFLRNRSSVKKALTNLGLGAFLAFVICFPWYFYNFADLVKYSRIFSTGESDDPTGILSAANLLFYPRLVSIYQTLFLPAICLLAGLALMLFKDKKQFGYIATYILLSPIVFLFIANKNLRYVLPLTPVFAYLIAYFITNLPKKVDWFKYVIAGYLIVGSTFITFNQFKPNEPVLLPISYALGGPNYKVWYDNPSFYSYDPNYYPIDQVLEYIYKDANKPEDRGLGIGNLSDSQKFSAATVEMVRLEKRMKNVFIPVPYFQFTPFKSDAEMDTYFTESGSEYVIAPGSVGPSGLRNYAALTQLSDYLRSGRNQNFRLIKTFVMPDKTEIGIFKRQGVTEEIVAKNECSNKAGFLDGVETIKLEPNTTYVMFTGHFALQDKLFKEYESGVLYVLQIENTVHTSTLDVHNLPRSGSSLCVRPGLKLDLTNEITQPIKEKNHCGDGIDCKKVVHVLWSVGDPVPTVTAYNRE